MSLLCVCWDIDGLKNMLDIRKVVLIFCCMYHQGYNFSCTVDDIAVVCDFLTCSVF